MKERSVYSINQRRRLEAETRHEREERLQQLSDNQQRKLDTETTALRSRSPHNAPSIYISYVRHFWSRGPRATRKRKPAHLKVKGHMHACCIYVANASRAITTLIERLHMYSSSLITSSAG